MQSQLCLNPSTSIQSGTNEILPRAETGLDQNRQYAKNAKAYLPIFIAILVLTIASGCERSPSYRTKLAENERIAEKAPVLVDDFHVGFVKAIIVERGDRIAILVVTDKEATQKKLRQGTVRVTSDDGQIHLSTDAVEVQSPLLTRSATIPVVSKTELTVRRLTSSRNLVGLLAGLAMIAVLVLLFRRLARGWLLLLTLILSAAGAWAALPWTSEAVAKLYALRPQPDPLSSATTTQGSGAGQRFSKLIRNPPDPRTVGYAAVFVVAFVTISVGLRHSLNRLHNRT